MATSSNEQWAKNIWVKQDFSRNISIKVLSKYLQLLGSQCHIFNFPHYKSMENLTCHGIQPKEIIFLKNIKFVKVNMMKIFTKSQPHREYGFRGNIFFKFFMTDRRLLKKHFYQSFVKISARSCQ